MPENIFSVEAVATGLVGLGAGGFAIWRYLKGAMTGDALDAKAQAIITNLQTILSNESEKNHRLNDVIDKVMRERNDAVQAVGKLQGTIELLTGQVELLKKEIVRLEVQNKERMEELVEAMKKFGKL